MYQSLIKMEVICKTCRERFSEDDIEMMVNIFFAWGGYFGEFDKSKFSMHKTILEFAEELDAGNSTFHLQNVKMWHKILTHGITPKEFLEKLSVFAEQQF